MMVDVASLPREVLLRIFSYYLETETQLDFIYNISCVCRAWREVCMDSSLWCTFDGTLPLSVLKKFCKEGYLWNTQLLKFCKFENPPSSRDLRTIYGNLPGLKSINFSKASPLFYEKDCKFFYYLINHCPYLCEIVLQEERLNQPPRIHRQLLEDFLLSRGPQLTCIDISHTSVSGLKELFTTIASSCPNLEELKAQYLRYREDYFPTGCMQSGLKKLKVLRLGSPIIIKNCTKEPDVGFPNLEIFTHPCVRGNHMTNLGFRKIVMKSPNLRVLDIRGCVNAKPKALNDLPTSNLEGLYVSYTKIYEYYGFLDILTRWSHSLAALDISKMKGNRINRIFNALIPFGNLQNLEILYLNNTEVTLYTVQMIIQNCTKLNFLDLESCRSLCRGYRRKYYEQVHIRELLKLVAG